MPKYLIAIFAAALGVMPASAQMTVLGAGASKSAASFRGPGDVISGWDAFWSCRAFTAAKAGTKAYRIVRASDGTQTDINSLANGLCDTSTPATFCNATTCKIVTYYDQAGTACAGSTACDVTQSTDGLRPQWTASALNGWPCATSVRASGMVMTAGATLTQAQPFTLMSVSKRTGTFANLQRIIVNGNAGNPNLSFSNLTNTVQIAAGATLNATASDSAFHAMIGVFNNTSSSNVIDGSATSGSVSTNSFANAPTILNDATPANAMDGVFCEGGIINSGINATQYGNLDSNMRSSTNGWNF